MARHACTYGCAQSAAHLPGRGHASVHLHPVVATGYLTRLHYAFRALSAWLCNTVTVKTGLRRDEGTERCAPVMIHSFMPCSSKELQKPFAPPRAHDQAASRKRGLPAPSKLGGAAMSKVAAAPFEKFRCRD